MQCINKFFRCASGKKGLFVNFTQSEGGLTKEAEWIENEQENIPSHFATRCSPSLFDNKYPNINDSWKNISR